MVPPLIRKVIIITILSLVVSRWSLVSYAQEPKYVRVAVMQDIFSFRLKVNGFYEILDPKDKKVLYRGKKARPRPARIFSGLSNTAYYIYFAY